MNVKRFSGNPLLLTFFLVLLIPSLCGVAVLGFPYVYKIASSTAYSHDPDEFRQQMDLLEKGMSAAEVDERIPLRDSVLADQVEGGLRETYLLVPSKNSVWGLPVLKLAIRVNYDEDGRMRDVHFADL